MPCLRAEPASAGLGVGRVTYQPVCSVWSDLQLRPRNPVRPRPRETATTPTSPHQAGPTELAGAQGSSRAVPSLPAAGVGRGGSPRGSRPPTGHHRSHHGGAAQPHPTWNPSHRGRPVRRVPAWPCAPEPPLWKCSLSPRWAGRCAPRTCVLQLLTEAPGPGDTPRTTVTAGGHRVA